MQIPSNQKPAIKVTNIGLYVAAKQHHDTDVGRIKNGMYEVLHNGQWIPHKEYKEVLAKLDKILRPINYKGMNKDNRSHMNLGFRSN